MPSESVLAAEGSAAALAINLAHDGYAPVIHAKLTFGEDHASVLLVVDVHRFDDLRTQLSLALPLFPRHCKALRHALW